MKCSISINLSSRNFVDVMYDEMNDMFEITLYVNSNSNLEDVLKRDNFDVLLREALSNCDDDEEIYKYSIEGINLILENDFPILNNSNISVYPEDGIEDFINNNPCLKNKTLIVDGNFDINHDSLDPLLQHFSNHKDYLVLINGNSKYVTIEEYEKTVLAIDEIVNKIKKYNLSPLEQIMYAYDLVRDRIYTSEDKNEDLSVSRDLSSALLGDKIVCVGYAVIFEKVLDNLGIKSEMITLHRKNTNRGHRRNMIYVDDPKYDVNGIYFFDATWDSKKKNNEFSFLDSYKFFCKTKEEINKYDSINYEDLTLDEIDTASNIFENIISTSELKNVPRKIVKLINYISNLVDGKDLINVFMLIDTNELPEFLKYEYNNEELIEKVKYYFGLIKCQQLGYEKLTKLLYNVRKIEYYEEPSKYPFSFDDFEKTIVDEGLLSGKEILLKALFGDDNKSYDEFYDIANRMELEKMIERIKLSRTLRKVYESKKNEDSSVKKI